MLVDVTVLGLVGGAPGGETPRVADSSAAGSVYKLVAVCKTLASLGSRSWGEAYRRSTWSTRSERPLRRAFFLPAVTPVFFNFRAPAIAPIVAVPGLGRGFIRLRLRLVTSQIHRLRLRLVTSQGSPYPSRRLRLVTSQGSPYPSRSPRAHPSGWTRTQGLSHRDSHAPPSFGTC